MDETIIALKRGVILTEVDGKTVLSLNGKTNYAKNAAQSALLQALYTNPQHLEVILNLLSEQGESSYVESEISLAMAEFILDFGEYLE